MKDNLGQVFLSIEINKRFIEWPINRLWFTTLLNDEPNKRFIGQHFYLMKNPINDLLATSGSINRLLGSSLSKSVNHKRFMATVRKVYALVLNIIMSISINLQIHVPTVTN